MGTLVVFVSPLRPFNLMRRVRAIAAPRARSCAGMLMQHVACKSVHDQCTLRSTVLLGLNAAID